MCTRAALAMLSSTTSWMPQATSAAESPTRAARRSSAARPAPASTFTSPPAK
jgi:hypothetical protein